MEQKKMPFFIKIKNAITNFEGYRFFSEEKTWSAIKYVLKLMIIFTIIVSIALTYKMTEQINDTMKVFKDECPDFRFENNTLLIDNENKQFIKGDENGYFGLVIDSEKENLSDIEKTLEYQRVIAVLKNKIVIKNNESIESSIPYEQLNQKYDLSNINKNTIVQFVSRK